MKSMLWVLVGIGVLAAVGLGIGSVAMEIFDAAKAVAQEPMGSNATNGIKETTTDEEKEKEKEIAKSSNNDTIGFE